MFRLSGLVLALVVGLVAVGVAHAQTLTVLASINGFDVYGGVTLSGNTLYGTTMIGGPFPYNDGGVFSVPVTGGTPTLLASFNGTNGQYPEAGLTLSADGSTLYSTTWEGGAYDHGTVFSVPLTGGSPTVLASFNGSNGESPCAGLTLSGNTLYGTANVGGANNDGTVFSVPVSGGSPTVLASFNGGNGASGLTISGNTLYGTNPGGGAYGDGTVFSVPVGGGSPTVLASFNGSDGEGPEGGLTLSADGRSLYGTTLQGGVNGDGTVFSVPVGGGSPTVLASFNGTNGKEPGGLTLSGNTLYGTTSEGGANSPYDDGTVFSVPVTGGTPTLLVTFDGGDGECPGGGLTLSGNTLYGATIEGGVHGFGTIFALTVPEPSTVTLLLASVACLLGYAWRRRKRNS
jgi:uncharacterized repeat protein (TIGR03803 family)